MLQQSQTLTAVETNKIANIITSSYDQYIKNMKRMNSGSHTSVTVNCHSEANKTSNVTVTEVQSRSRRLFAGTWRLLVSVITTLYYVGTISFDRRVRHRALSLRYACIRSSGITRIPWLLQISSISQPPLLS